MKTTYYRDPRNLALEETDALNHKVTYTYDDEGHLLLRKTTPMDDFTDALVGPALAAATEITDRYVYDKPGRRTAEIVDEGTLALKTVYTPDEDGNIVEVLSPLAGNNRVAYSFEERGQLWKKTTGKGSANALTEFYYYDKAGNRTAWVDTGNHLTEYRYDEFLRLERIVFPNQTEQIFVRDEHDNVTEVRLEGSAGIALKDKKVVLSKREFKYDEWDRMYLMTEHVIEPDGTDSRKRFQVEQHFDAASRIVKEVTKGTGGTSAPDLEVTFTHDTARRVHTRTDNLGNVQTFTYRGLRNIATEANKDISGYWKSSTEVTTTYTYDALGRVTDVSAGPSTTRICYDSRGRQRLVFDAAGNVREMRYDAAGRMNFEYEKAQAYDAITFAGTFGDQIKAKAESVKVTEHNNDVNSRLKRKTGSWGTVDFTYDALNRLTDAVANQGQPGESKVHIEYDYAGLPGTITDPYGTAITNLYDSMGKLVSRTVEPSLAQQVRGTTEESYFYDGLGRPVLLLDHQNTSLIVQSYNSLGQTCMERQMVVDTSALPQLKALFNYQIISECDGRGNRRKTRFPAFTVDYDRDVMGRVSKVMIGAVDAPFFQAAAFTFYYAGPGHRTDVVKANNGWDYFYRRNYDKYQRLEGYDVLGDLSKFFSFSQTFELDDQARLIKITQEDGRFREAHQWPRHTVDRFEYDRAGQLIRAMTGIENNEFTRAWSVNAYRTDGSTQTNISIMWDPYASVWDGYKWIIADTLYNPLIPLASKVLDIEWGDPGVYIRRQEDLTTKVPGQISGKTMMLDRIDDGGSLLKEVFSAGWDHKDTREASYTYDNNGNLRWIEAEIGENKEKHKIKEFRYDYRNRLVEAWDYLAMDLYTQTHRPTASYGAYYLYDASNRMTQVLVKNNGVTTPSEFSRFLCWDGEQLVEEMERVAVGKVRATARYVWGPERHMLLTVDKRTRGRAAADFIFDRYYVVQAPDGKPLGLTDDTGSMVEVYDENYKGQRKVLSRFWQHDGTLDQRDAFLFDGQELKQQFVFDDSPLGFRFCFGGHFYDEVSGLIYVRNRWYSPELGRFISRDPSNLFNDNAYSYGGNNPVGGVDPTGAELVTILVIAGIGAAISGIVSLMQQPYENIQWSRVGKDAVLGGVAAAVTAGVGLAAAAAIGAAEGTAAAFLADTIANTSFDVIVHGEDALTSLTLNSLSGGLFAGVGAAASAALGHINNSAMRGFEGSKIASSWPEFNMLKEYRPRFYRRVEKLASNFDFALMKRLIRESKTWRGDTRGYGSLLAGQLEGEAGAAISGAVLLSKVRNLEHLEAEISAIGHGQGRRLDWHAVIAENEYLHFNVEVKNGRIKNSVREHRTRKLTQMEWDSEALRSAPPGERMRWQGNAAPLVPVWFALQGFKGEAEHGVRIVNFRISESRWLDQMIAAFGEHRIIP